MAFCTNCGTQIPDGAPFCANCGTAQNPGLRQQPGGMQYQQPQMQATMQQAQQKPPKKSRTGLIIGLVCGGVALVAGIVVLILFLTGVIGGGGGGGIAATTDIAVTGGGTDMEEEYPEGLTIGTDIPLEQISGVSFSRGNGLGREGNGYAFSKYGDIPKYSAYEYHFDENAGEEVRTEWETDLTEEEWKEMLFLLEGALYYKDPFEIMDESASFTITWASGAAPDGVFRDSIHFPDEARAKAFSDLRQKLTPVPEKTGRSSGDATPEDVEAFLAGGTWELLYGGWAEGPARPEMIFQADNSVTFRMPADEAGASFTEVKGTYIVSHETQERTYPDLLTLSFDRIPDEMPADYAQLAGTDAPTENFSFYIAAGAYGTDYLNLYITGNNGYSVIADRLFGEENQTSDKWKENWQDNGYPNFESGWVFTRYKEGDIDPEEAPELRANADFYAMIWEDWDGMLLSYMNMEEHTDVFAEGDSYYYFSYDGAPELVYGYEIDYDAVGDRMENAPYFRGMGRMPCVMAHITTGPDAKITSMEYYTYAGFMHWEAWTGAASVSDGNDFTDFDEVLAYYREVLPAIDPETYDGLSQGSLADDLYTYYVGFWPEDPLHYFSYAYTDLNGDGREEMLIGTTDGETTTIHQILSVGVYDQKVHLIASAGYRSYLNVFTNGSFAWGGSSSAFSYTDYIYRLNEAGDLREFVEGYKYDDAEEAAGGPWFRAVPTGEMYEGFYDMNYEPITEAEVDAMIAKYTEQTFQWKMLAE